MHERTVLHHHLYSHYMHERMVLLARTYTSALSLAGSWMHKRTLKSEYMHDRCLESSNVLLAGIRRFIKELEEDGKIYEQLYVQQCQLQSAAGGGQLPDLTRSGEHIGLLDNVDEEREEYFDELDESSRQNSMEGRR